MDKATFLLGASCGAVLMMSAYWLDVALKQTPNAEVEGSADGNYLSVPGGAKVYKYYDDVGAVCFVVLGTNGNASIDCIEGERK